MLRWKRHWDELPGDLPVDVLPCSNGEFLPRRPGRNQKLIMRLADERIEQARGRTGLSRREFVRTAAAYAICFSVIDQVMGTRWGSFAWAHNTKTNRADDLEFPDARFTHPEGEFIFDIQSHHVESDGRWRLTNPGFEVFFAAIWAQAGGVGPAAQGDPYWLRPDRSEGELVISRGGREVDPIENLSRYHYLKELYLDSSTDMCVLSAVPASPDDQPLPIDRAALTVDTVNSLAGSQRCLMHAFVMPNRGSIGTTSSSLGARPLFQQEEFDMMERHASIYGGLRNGGILAGWKTYPAWGDVPNATGWFFDDDTGLAFCQQVLDVSRAYGVAPLIATHKGFALPGFDQRAASPRDIGPAARQFPGLTFVVYHSGYDTEQVGPYPGDDKVNAADRSVDAFIKSLRENGLDATRHVPPGLEHGNAPNVYAEIGSTWRSVMTSEQESTAQAAHLLGKLIKYVGPMRICWGTDSLWFGSPQSEIMAFRQFNLGKPARDLYNLPWGLDGDARDPTRNALDGASYLSARPEIERIYGEAFRWNADGVAHPEWTIRNAVFGYNAARAYGIDPNLKRAQISTDDVQKLRDAYLVNQGTPNESAPLAMHQLHGFRTPEALLKERAEGTWSP